MHVPGSEHPLAGEVHAAEIREGAAGADDLCSSPRARGKGVAKRGTDLLAQLPNAPRRDAVGEITFGQPQRTEGQGGEIVEHARGTQCQFQRTATNVHDHGAAGGEVEVREGAAKAQPGFILSVEHADLESGLLPHAREESGSILRVAHRARGDCLDALGAKLLRECRHPRDGFDGALDRAVAEYAGGIDVGAEPGRGLHFIDDGNRAIGRDVGDDLAHRVGADVDGGDARAGCRALLARRRRARAFSLASRCGHG